MRKKDELSEEDITLFREANRGTKVLRQTKVEQEPPTTIIKKRKKEPSPPPDTNPLNLRTDEYATEVSGDDILEFYRGGLQHKVLRKLRQGQYNVEATLDMHGMRVTEALEILNYFIIDCLERNKRHVLIIHGKGRGHSKPVLKNKLNQWLRQIEHVLAFRSANQKDGYTGAVYVLLKGKT